VEALADARQPLRNARGRRPDVAAEQSTAASESDRSYCCKHFPREGYKLGKGADGCVDHL